MAETSFDVDVLRAAGRGGSAAPLFTEFSQIQAGLDWVSPRVTEEQRLEALWANARPGYRLAKIRLNWYRRVTAFWVGGMWGEEPRVRLRGFEQGGERRGALSKAFARAQRDRSVKGAGAVMIEQGGWVRWVDTSFVHPVVWRQDESQVMGHIVGYPWRTGRDGGQVTPNRLDILKLPEGGGATRERWTLEGVTLGKMIGAPMPTDAERVVTFGDWVSDYWDLEDLILELENRFQRLRVALDRNSAPHMQGPSTSPPSDAQEEFAEGLWLPRDVDDPPFEYVQLPAGGFQSHFEHIREIQDQIHIQSSVPVSVFGTTSESRSGGRQSGVSKERSMYTALQRLRMLRREATEAIREVLGGEDVEVDWPNDPFADFSERAEVMVKLASADLIGREGVHERLFQS